MTNFYHEWLIQQQFRDLEALDRQLDRWGWFRSFGESARKRGWRVRVGASLIRVGSWLQGEGSLWPFSAPHEAPVPPNAGVAGETEWRGRAG